MNEDQPIVETLEPADVGVIYQQDKAVIDMQIATAKAYPRNIKRAMDNAIAIVSMDRETASTCTYSLPRGGKSISGPSVHLAKILSQVWGNLRVEAKVVSIDGRQVTSQAVAFDLENNLAIKVEVKRSIMGNKGRFNDDMITVTGNAANSIAIRNAVLSVIPRNIVDKVYKAAKDAITGDISDESKLISTRKAVLDGLQNTYGLKEPEILAAIGKAAVNHITGDDLVVLIGIGQAIKDGDTTVEEAFRSKKGGTTDPNVHSAQVEEKRASDWIEKAKTQQDLDQVGEYIDGLPAGHELKAKFLAKKKEIEAVNKSKK
jgi:hypothetical protein